ncbi:hypothetical protein GCM10010372_51030 [Streptomyces tauricus]|nr:hypothetical protein GCM10010372_51030 [Streptomyces tauricus]
MVRIKGSREKMGKGVGEAVGALEVHEGPGAGLTVDHTMLVVSVGAFICRQSRHGHLVAAQADKAESGQPDVRASPKAFRDDAPSNHEYMLANWAPRMNSAVPAHCLFTSTPPLKRRCQAPAFRTVAVPPGRTREPPRPLAQPPFPASLPLPSIPGPGRQ